MVIAGAGGHAKEVLDVLGVDHPFIFDDHSKKVHPFFQKYVVLQSLDAIATQIGANFDFVLALGNPHARYKVYQKLIHVGGVLKTVVSNHAIVSPSASLGEGLNIMDKVYIGAMAEVGRGVLLNCGCNVHHDVVIGAFSDVAPGALLLGGVEVGKSCMIGAGSTILPKVKVGSGSVIGAGSTVTKDIPDNVLAFGSPARVIRKLT